ncbi:hypothetical protein ACSBLW_08900 [Thioclava sp. FR2]|uniref:hypothetical protein n=1 Tax=Thioclava sp. FR2 TaxID=3445780 RepID=UPI003EBB25CC
MSFRIIPVGSCRIWNPLSAAQPTYGYKIDRTRYLGFTHTSAGALQQVRFTFGEIDIPQHMMRFMIHTDPQVIPRDGPMETIPDLAIIEISSAKQFELDGFEIQINCMQREFESFFADQKRKNNFIRVIRTRDQNEIDRFLRETWSQTDEQTEDVQILRRIRLHMTTEEDLRRDVRALMSRFPESLFVTHVDALGRNGDRVPLRDQLISLLSRIVQEEGGLVYNPTPRMLEMGQPLAMPQDENHFSQDFGAILVKDWHDLIIGSLMEHKAAS